MYQEASSRNARRTRTRRVNLARKLASKVVAPTFRIGRKRRFRRTGRQLVPQEQQKPPPERPLLKFGSFNVNGLDAEAGYVIDELLKDRGFDV